MVALFSLAGAPGVTTLSLALAGAWPSADPVRMVEADASGGDVAAWWGLPPWPGVVDLAATSRSGQDHERPDLFSSTQVLPGGTRVCVAPSTAERTTAALELLAQNPKVLGEGVTVVDLGRVGPEGVSAALLGAADLAVAVTSGDVAQLKRVKEADWWGHNGPPVGAAVLGADHSSSEISSTLGMPVWARLPQDRKTAEFLANRANPSRVHRRPLIKAARALAHTLIARAENPTHPERVETEEAW